MQTVTYPAYESDSTALSQPAIAAAADLLRQGELVAFPTETVYGLGANALDAAAVAKVFTAKGRPSTDPLIVHIHTAGQVGQVAAEVTPLARRLMDAFWPGPLTVILPKTERIPPSVTAGLPTVAVRLPAHPVALALLREAGVPVVAPSANTFAHTSPTTAQHVLADLDGRIAAVLDAGPTPVGVESSVVDATGPIPRLLRPGGVPLEALREVAGRVEVVEARATEETPTPGPGMQARHYAPHIPLTLFEGPTEAVHAAIRQAAQNGRRVGLLLADDDLPALDDVGTVTVVLGPLSDPAAVAARLYAALRTLEAHELDVILARGFPPEGAGLAVRDRLRRAAEGRVVTL
jgi:L-threonylcarbamoyladenylate synthase